MIARFLNYQLGAHQIDWEILAGAMAVVFAFWVWSACKLASRSIPTPGPPAGPTTSARSE